MKATALIGVIALSAMLGVVLTGDRPFMAAHAQEGTEPVDTNLAVSAEMSLPAASSALPAAFDPDAPAGQLVRLLQAGVDQGVILAYIRNTPRFFELDAESIIYLTDLGTSAEVIEAVIEHDQQLFEAGTAAGEAEELAAIDPAEDEPDDVTVETLQDALSPYGTWVQVEGYGRCWRPAVVVYDRDWRPYSDNGQWVYTDRGWYWKSNYSWGWAAFHYGRWFEDARYGWCWWPDTAWAPSWVHWRYNSSYCGWAPLPPHTAYRSGVGLVYRGRSVSAGFDFYLTDSAFTFVSARNFCAPNLRLHRLGRQQVPVVFRKTRSHHRIKADPRRHGLVNYGIPPAHIRTATRRNLTPVTVQQLRRRLEQQGKPVEQIDSRTRKARIGKPVPRAAPVPEVKRSKKADPKVDKPRKAAAPKQVKTPPPRKKSPVVKAPQPAPKVTRNRSAAPRVARTDPRTRTKPQVVRPVRKPKPAAQPNKKAGTKGNSGPVE